MTSTQQRAALQRQIWQIANDVRGAVDGWDFKQYVLGTLFYRFISENFASYSGTTPKVKASGGKFRYGKMRKQSNNYLKWAFIEAANVVVRHRNHPGWRDKHVSRLYERIRRRKGHAVAVGAIARHLSEAAFWVLKKGEPYKEPDPRTALPKQGRARA